MQAEAGVQRFAEPPELIIAQGTRFVKAVQRQMVCPGMRGHRRYVRTVRGYLPPQIDNRQTAPGALSGKRARLMVLPTHLPQRASRGPPLLLPPEGVLSTHLRVDCTQPPHSQLDTSAYPWYNAHSHGARCSGAARPEGPVYTLPCSGAVLPRQVSGTGGRRCLSENSEDTPLSCRFLAPPLAAASWRSVLKIPDHTRRQTP